MTRDIGVPFVWNVGRPTSEENEASRRRVMRHVLKERMARMPAEMKAASDDMFRASKDCLCPTCGCEYDLHPHATEPENIGFHGPFLHRLCTGALVKL